MAQGELKEKDFGDAVIAHFSELREDIEEWTGLVTLQMMEFRLFAEKQALSGNADVLNECVALLHRSLIDGDSELRNAVHVSFLEHVDRREKVGKIIYDALTPELRKGWQDINDYLDKLLNRTPMSND